MPQAGDRFGEFVLRREIGRGAIGTVWEADQPSLDRRVAVKVLSGSTGGDPVWIARFKAEAGAAAKLSHPGILPVFGIGETRGLHWFAMELVDGKDFAARLGDAGPLAPREAATVIRDAALALDHAHANGVVHRDVKPANLMTRADGRVAVTDFGLAKHVGSGALTTTGLLVGTPYYMSPELVRARKGEQVGPTADVYGLGATLYELLLGRPPFQAENAMTLIAMIGEQDPTPPSKVDPKVPRDLDTIVLTCLRKRPERRYGSAGELAADLQRFLDHQPIAMRRPGVGERMGRFVRRHQVATGVTLAALLLVGTIYGVFRSELRSRDAEIRKLEEILSEADSKAVAGDFDAGVALYREAEEQAESREEKQQVAAGRQFLDLLDKGVLERQAADLVGHWRSGTPAHLHLVTDPPEAEVSVVQVGRQGASAASFERKSAGSPLAPGFYRFQLKAPGRVPTVANVVALPELDATLRVTLPPAAKRFEGMTAFAGTWTPDLASREDPARPLAATRHGRTFLLDTHRTTNRAYRAFLQSVDPAERDALTPRSWGGGEPSEASLDSPVLGLSPLQAGAYAASRGKRLPTPPELHAAVVPGIIAARGRPGPTQVARIFHLRDGAEVLRKLDGIEWDGTPEFTRGAKGGVEPWQWSHPRVRVELGAEPPRPRRHPGLRLALSLD